MTRIVRPIEVHVLRIVCAFVVVLSLVGLLSCTRSRLPPFGQELSSVQGVSIVRVRPTSSSVSSSGGGEQEAHIDAHGIDVLTCLGTASGNHDPIIILADLPDGQYDISARVDTGGRQELTKLVCRAFSEAFGCRTTRRMVAVEAVVLSCRDRQALRLMNGPAEQGFYRHDEMSKTARRTHFSTTLDSLAWYAGYVARNTAAQNVVPNRNTLLKKVFVNETGIEGHLEGAVDWDLLDSNVSQTSLKNLGFELATAKRTVPAIVVEPGAPGQDWTFLSVSGRDAATFPRIGGAASRVSDSTPSSP